MRDTYPGAVEQASGVLVVIVEVDTQEEVLEVGLVASVHQLGHHCGGEQKVARLGPLWTLPFGPRAHPAVVTAHL